MSRAPVGAVLAGGFSPLPSSNTTKNLVFPGTETTMFSLKARLCISCSPASPAFDAMRSRNKMLLSSWPLAPPNPPGPPTRKAAIVPTPVMERTRIRFTVLPPETEPLSGP